MTASNYNIEQTIRSLKRTIETETDEHVQIVAHSDYHIISRDQGILLTDFDFDDWTGHRLFLRVFRQTGETTYKSYQHPKMFDLVFGISLYSTRQVGLWRLMEKIERYFLKHRSLEVTLTFEDEETVAYQHELEMIEPFRGSFRANMSDLQQLQGRAIIRSIPVFLDEDPVTGSLITQILIRILDDKAEEPPQELGTWREPKEPEIPFEEE